MLQEKEIEHSRQKAYMDQLLSLVIEHAPIVLGKLHAHEEARYTLITQYHMYLCTSDLQRACQNKRNLNFQPPYFK